MAVIVGGRVNNVNSIINNLQHLSSRAKRRISDTYTVSLLRGGWGCVILLIMELLNNIELWKQKTAKEYSFQTMN